MDMMIPKPKDGYEWEFVFTEEFSSGDVHIFNGDITGAFFKQKKKHKEPEFLVHVNDPGRGECEFPAVTDEGYFTCHGRTMECIGRYLGMDIIHCTSGSTEWLYFGHWNDGPKNANVEE